MEEQGNQMNHEEIRDRIPSEPVDASLDFDELKKQLESDLSSHLADIQLLEEQKAAIGNPDSLGKTILNVVWLQFINQIGTVAGEDFIRENRNLPLNLSYDAHVQSETNFINGKTANHNAYTDYQQRYDNWQDKFEKHTDGSQPAIKAAARRPFDQGRPMGSKEKGTAMDHVVPVAELVRDPAVNAHMSLEEQVAFANSEKNLHEMDAGLNQSKRDKTTEDWLDNPNLKEKKNISPEQEAKLRQTDKEAREELERLKQQAKERDISTGKQSRTEEALRVGGKALRSVIMGLLAQLIRKIIGKLISWFKAKARNLESLIDQIKTAIIDFFKDVKSNLMVSADTAITTIVVSAVGDFVRKIWVMLKQAARSVIEAIEYLKNPANRKKSVGILTLEVGKIIVAGLTAAGAILLGEVIEKALLSIPVFGITIPLLGSLASLIGMFLSGVIMGIAGALVMSLIDSLIANTQHQEITKSQIDKNNDILATQQKIITVKRVSSDLAREKMLDDIERRHSEATKVINSALDNIFGPSGLPEST